MSRINRREKIFIGVLLILIVVFLIFMGLKTVGPKDDFLESLENEDLDLEDEKEEDKQDLKDELEGQYIYVHVSGQVRKPGLIKLESGSRVADAIELCQGATEKACLDRLNLAKKLLDEDKIHVPKFDEELGQEISDKDRDPRLNINTCSREELMTLPGIGEITADKIISFREEETFKQDSDIMKVSGIGQKKFEDIKDLIRAK